MFVLVTICGVQSKAQKKNCYEDDLGKDFEFPRLKEIFEIQMLKHYWP